MGKISEKLGKVLAGVAIVAGSVQTEMPAAPMDSGGQKSENKAINNINSENRNEHKYEIILPNLEINYKNFLDELSAKKEELQTAAEQDTLKHIMAALQKSDPINKLLTALKNNLSKEALLKLSQESGKTIIFSTRDNFGDWSKERGDTTNQSNEVINLAVFDGAPKNLADSIIIFIKDNYKNLPESDIQEYIDIRMESAVVHELIHALIAKKITAFFENSPLLIGYLNMNFASGGSNLFNIILQEGAAQTVTNEIMGAKSQLEVLYNRLIVPIFKIFYYGRDILRTWDDLFLVRNEKDLKPAVNFLVQSEKTDRNGRPEINDDLQNLISFIFEIKKINEPRLIIKKLYKFADKFPFGRKVLEKHLWEFKDLYFGLLDEAPAPPVEKNQPSSPVYSMEERKIF